MKKIIVLSVLTIIATTVHCQQPQTQKQSIPQTKAQQTQQQPAIKLTSNADSSQYILGAYLGQYLVSNGISITNANLFIRGMDDVLSNKPLLVAADSIPKRMNEYLGKMIVERSRTLEKQLFDALKGQPGVGTLPTGVCYVVIKAGTGIRPQVTDSITAMVKGYLPDGRVFEDTYQNKIPLKSTPANLIPGLRETLQIMPAGSTWRIYIPSAQAYAEKGIQGIIPPFSAIVFDIELLKVGTGK
ncbi:MAG TPA: FKBP-type peptidyl-prolyl cis-trans isomerase [Bacteroidales bacterium]|nr:FKBP-type peptidyl-prolyl cis-trans isomerase [Bacteroidales bacterium]